MMRNRQSKVLDLIKQLLVNADKVHEKPQDRRAIRDTITGLPGTPGAHLWRSLLPSSLYVPNGPRSPMRPAGSGTV